MKPFSILLALVFCISTGTIAAKEINAKKFVSMTPSSSGSKIPQTLSTAAREFSVNVPAFAEALKAGQQSIIINDFPISATEMGTLQLSPVRSIVDAETEWFVGSKRVAGPNVVAYRGTIIGEPNSRVLINYAAGDMVGCVIHSDGAKYVISPYSTSTSADRPHVIGEENALRKEHNAPAFLCGTEDIGADLPSVSDLKKKYGTEILSTRLLEVEVLIECTDEFYRLRNDEEKALAYVVSLYNMVNMIYEDEANITFKILGTQLWTTEEPDEYPNSGKDNRELLREVVNKWRGRSNPRDLYCVLTSPGTTNVLGISNGIGGMCNNTDGSLSGYVVCGISGFMNLPTLAYSDEVMTITHEIGHNIAAYHTHNCAWKPPLDSCTSSGVDPANTFYSDACNKGTPVYNTGSIMSYCHLWGKGVPLTFLKRVSDALRAAADTKPCLTEPTVAMVKVDYPFGNHVFTSGTTQEIRWTSAKVAAVKIEYSTDNGKTWTVVPGAENIDAKTGGREFGNAKISWVIPTVVTTQGLIRISDASNSAVTSQSLGTFTIQEAKIAAIALQSQLAGARYGQKEKLDLQWTATLVPRVKIEFSSNGGSSWSTLVASQTGTGYTFDVPDIETSEAMIQISDVSNSALVSRSGTFAIGKERLLVLTPNGGDTVCASKDFEIRWATDFIGSSSSRVRVEYSADNGNVWNNLTGTLGVEARLGKFNWTATNKIASARRALVRLTYRVDTSLKAQSAANFTILTGANCTVVGVDEAPENFGTLTVSPNPISSNGVATIEFPAPCASIECLLVDAKGARVAQFGNYDNMSAGKHEIRFDVSGIPSGAYFLTLSCGGQRISAPVTILR